MTDPLTVTLGAAVSATLTVVVASLVTVAGTVGVLIGALGGMAVAGILGMLVGETLLALGYQIFMGWVHTNPDAGNGKEKSETPAAR